MSHRMIVMQTIGPDVISKFTLILLNKNPKIYDYRPYSKSSSKKKLKEAQ